MAGLEYFAHAAELPRGTLAGLFLDSVARLGEAPAFRRFLGETDRTEDISYDEALDAVRAVVGGLRELGLERGDRVAILSENRPEWALLDYGCICAGVVDVPIYTTLTVSQAAYILDDSGAAVVFAEDRAQMEKALEACNACRSGVRVVVFEDLSGLPADVMRWRDFLASGRERMAGATGEEFESGARRARPEDVTTIIYTSGTTGDPKGVLLTHGNLFSNVEAAALALPISTADVTLSFLPLSHAFQRMVDYLLFSRGCTIAYAHDISNVAHDLEVIRPTIVVSVPRLYEKVYNRVMEVGGLKRKLVQWAREVGTAWAEEKLAGREPSAVLRAVYALADRLVYRKIRAGVGGRIRFFVSGGAPLEPAINRFFYSVGLTILEGYGLTETSPVTHVNTEEHFRIGTVGRPVAGTETRIAEDGEILIRGPQVMKGYHGDPEGTRAAIDGGGWFHTGDVGRIDRDGFLRITDRKKDIIVTAGGKNVAPQPLENRLKTNPWIDQVVMVGDRRKFVALLVVPSFPRLEAWAKEQGVSWSDRGDLVRNGRVQALMKDEVLGDLDDLASYERPKKLALLSEELSVEAGTLTPTQKVKRRVIQERYDALIDRFYERENADRTVFAE